MLRRLLFAALFLGAIAVPLVSCNSGDTSLATSPIDMSPPQAPSNLHADNESATNRDRLEWDPSASVNVASYEVYTGPSAGSLSTLVEIVDASTTSYLLPIVGANTTEFYSVRAVGTNSVPSTFTSPLTVERTAWEGSHPAAIPMPGTENGD